ncbi:putative chaperone protein DNAj [Leptomonas pyrrhocoris]|uniref:Putative chaperone protein DNAj n=1 Tax=Leptomonas pyrrhocoris TaxID=157538 RepID=A0A0M9FSN0_LEPPY|nr:putative chaperone protein DNAj [Leptomonas pyrrhocoris]XP_015653709.1 putative chaperone protein DNAj [Leptomonas pyrrhocoris]KPA75269.1 putative chaperone protein DNAj [Leptomonas pyrrhocoris]KPA75270.1 putative chaperone protein DNAj [Leptomonas pyrrhocoris]|eukprot:XP_015653708.1 putative chaperone protein DNAj [Leptomonas pyrrhocoris]
MQMLSLTLPSLQSGEKALEFQVDDPPQLQPWIATYRLIPQGEAFCRTVALTTQLRHEDMRTQQAHADPNVARQWAAEEADGGAAGADNINGSGGDDGDDGAGEGGRFQPSSRKKKFVKLTDEDLLVDWYDVLKLEQQDGATEEQIKAAYRRRCLETHPDKQQNHSDELFKQVQRAFDILGDPDTRQTYDSSRPFDDAIPAEVVEEKVFYSSFGPVFERNKKWSSVPGVPSLGNDKTPYAEVLRFYDRWTGFQSWRDFSHLADIEEIDEGMCREEKRYYQRENQRQLSHFHKEEQKRIRTLVDRARRNDPRLRRHREEEEGKRQKEVQEREAFRQQLAAEEERRRAEETRKQKEKEEAEARAQQQEKQAMREAQTAVLGFLGEHGLLEEIATNKLFADRVRRPNVQWIFSKVTSAAAAQKLRDAILAASPTRVPRTDDDPRTKEFEGAAQVEAVLRFNALIAKMEQHCGVNRYGEAVKKAKEGGDAAAKKKQAAAPASPVAAGPEWTDEDLGRLQKATAKYPPGSVDRWIKICDVLRHKFTEEQAMAKVSELTAALHHAGSGNPTASAAAASVSHASAAGSGTPASVAGTTAAAAVEEWSMTQQKQLEQGLRDLKDYKEKDKYQKIAKMVEGKTAKECFDRFKFLCSVNKKK